MNTITETRTAPRTAAETGTIVSDVSGGIFAQRDVKGETMYDWSFTGAVVEVYRRFTGTDTVRTTACVWKNGQIVATLTLGKDEPDYISDALYDLRIKDVMAMYGVVLSDAMAPRFCYASETLSR